MFEAGHVTARGMTFIRRGWTGTTMTMDIGRTCKKMHRNDNWQNPSNIFYSDDDDDVRKRDEIRRNVYCNFWILYVYKGKQTDFCWQRHLTRKCIFIYKLANPPRQLFLVHKMSHTILNVCVYVYLHRECKHTFPAYTRRQITNMRLLKTFTTTILLILSIHYTLHICTLNEYKIQCI